MLILLELLQTEQILRDEIEHSDLYELSSEQEVEQGETAASLLLYEGIEVDHPSPRNEFEVTEAELWKQELSEEIKISSEPISHQKGMNKEGRLQRFWLSHPQANLQTLL